MQTIGYRTEGQLTRGLAQALASGLSVLLRNIDAPCVQSEFAKSVCEGLGLRERQLDRRFLYDDRGSEMYELICRQPEYCPTRTEDAILSKHASALWAYTGPARLRHGFDKVDAFTGDRQWFGLLLLRRKVRKDARGER